MVKKQFIIEQISNDIYNRRFLPGQKIYSVRELTAKFKCSHMTAFNALVELEKKTIIVPIERSGYFLTNDTAVLRRNGLIKKELGSVNQLNIVSHLLKSEHYNEIVPLGTASRFHSLLPIQKIMSRKHFKQEDLQQCLSSYSYPPGHFGLRTEIAKRYQKRKINLGPDNILLTSGALEAMTISLKAVASPGDKVLIPTPIFFGIIQILEQLKVRVVEVPCLDHGKLNTPLLIKHLKHDKTIKAAIIQANFSNPTSYTLSEKDKKTLVETAQKENVFLIEDDTYSDLTFQKKHVSCLKTYDRNQNCVFHCSSFSKTLGPGFRVGWIAPPKEFIEPVTQIKLSTSFSGSLLAETMVFNFISNSEQYETHLDHINQVFEKNVDRIKSDLEKLLKIDFQITTPKGGFCLWLTLPPSINTLELYKKLIEKNIAISPGLIFSSSMEYQNCLRINCAVEYNQSIKDALKKIAQEINHS